MFILATLGSWWRMWAFIRVAYYHSYWDISHLVQVKLHTSTPASSKSNSSSRRAAMGMEPCHSVPLPSPQRRLTARVQAWKLLLPSIHQPAISECSIPSPACTRHRWKLRSEHSTQQACSLGVYISSGREVNK